ncbi:Hypothetical_protein [Hexamita inflata]|uniref:Hypothetical_protein n=1 Tax=Hexamita inflata TaxID=28002 RepID=A0AA86RAN5_9EUKA|nr:Hypothetical protein HINF_LOCUS62584 [Hexamita inflata]
MNNIKTKDSVALSQQLNSIFIYNEAITQSNIQLDIYDVYNFAVFGINSAEQQIYQSVVNVSISFQIIQGALVCIQCNIKVADSSLIFDASGQKLSAVMLKSQDNIHVATTQIQFRFHSQLCSGIVFSLIKDNFLFTITQSQIIGYNFIDSKTNGYIVTEFLAKQITIAIQATKVCTNLIEYTGQQNMLTLLLTEQMIRSCSNICPHQLIPVYGLCKINLINGIQQPNNTKMCVDQFVFHSNQCICKQGYLLNQTMCVDILGYFQSLEQQIIGNTTKTNSLISNLSTIITNMMNDISVLRAQVNSLSSSSAQVRYAYDNCGGRAIQICGSGICGYFNSRNMNIDCNPSGDGTYLGGT